jgi:hypothetical protein
MVMNPIHTTGLQLLTENTGSKETGLLFSFNRINQLSIRN